MNMEENFVLPRLAVCVKYLCLLFVHDQESERKIYGLDLKEMVVLESLPENALDFRPLNFLFGFYQ